MLFRKPNSAHADSGPTAVNISLVSSAEIIEYSSGGGGLSFTFEKGHKVTWDFDKLIDAGLTLKEIAAAPGSPSQGFTQRGF